MVHIVKYEQMRKEKESHLNLKCDQLWKCLIFRTSECNKILSLNMKETSSSSSIADTAYPKASRTTCSAILIPHVIIYGSFLAK